MSDLNLKIRIVSIKSRKYICEADNLCYIHRSQLLGNIDYVITHIVIGNGIGFLHVPSTKQ